MSAAMKALQSRLAGRGFYHGAIDGICGPMTLAAFEAEAVSIFGRVPSWMPVARAEFGVSEIAGARHEQRIVMYHRHTSLRATSDEVPWCSSFSCFSVDMGGLTGTGSAMARSWCGWGVPAPWPPRYGDVCVFTRGRSPTAGHVTFFVAEYGPSLWFCLGGNQSNRVCVQGQAAATLLARRTHRSLIAQ